MRYTDYRVTYTIEVSKAILQELDNLLDKLSLEKGKKEYYSKSYLMENLYKAFLEDEIMRQAVIWQTLPDDAVPQERMVAIRLTPEFRDIVKKEKLRRFSNKLLYFFLHSKKEKQLLFLTPTEKE